MYPYVAATNLRIKLAHTVFEGRQVEDLVLDLAVEKLPCSRQFLDLTI